MKGDTTMRDINEIVKERADILLKIKLLGYGKSQQRILVKDGILQLENQLRLLV